MTVVATTFGRIDNTFSEISENKINVEILNEYNILKYENKNEVGFDFVNDIIEISKHPIVYNFIFSLQTYICIHGYWQLTPWEIIRYYHQNHEDKREILYFDGTC